MPKLADVRHEHFCQVIALDSKGDKLSSAFITRAYSEAYNKPQGHPARVGGYRLLKRDDVRTRIEEIRGERLVAVQREVDELIPTAPDLFTRVGRARELAKRRAQLMQVMAERAAYEDHQDVPGGKTGLVVTSTKSLGPNGTVKTHQVDLGLLQELRATEQQIAQELGQWVERSESTVKPTSEWTPSDWELQMGEYAAKFGLTVQQLEEQARLQLNGKVVIDTTCEPADGKQVM